MKKTIGILLAFLFSFAESIFAELNLPSGAGPDPVEAALEFKIAIFCPGPDKESAHYDFLYADNHFGGAVVTHHPQKNVHIQIDRSIKEDMRIYYFGENTQLVFRNEEARDKKIKRATFPCPGLLPPPSFQK